RAPPVDTPQKIAADGRPCTGADVHVAASAVVWMHQARGAPRGPCSRSQMKLASIALLLVALAPAAAHAQVPEPDDDPFYAVPANLEAAPNGTVLDARSIEPMGPLPLPARAWQVKYKTLGAENEPTATVTTVLVPDSPWSGPGPRPLVSYQVPEDGVGTRCTPSYALRAGIAAGGTVAQADMSVSLPVLIAQGWAVVTSDYEGPRSLFA